MSHYEGKNVFRTVFTQRPVYSGGSNIAAATAPAPRLHDAADKRLELTVLAHGNTLNVVHRRSGRTLCARDVGLEDDVILHVDCVVARAGGGGGGDAGEQQSADAAAAPAPATARADASPGEQQQQNTLLYVACSTRSLQISTFALLLESPSQLRKRNRNAFVSERQDDAKQAQSQKQQQQQQQQQLGDSGLKLDDGATDAIFSLSVIKQWTADQSAVSCLKFSPLTHHLASGSADGGLKVWSVFNHFLTHQFRGQGGVVTSLGFLAEDESLLAAGTFEGFVSVIDFSSKKVLASGRKHTAAVEALSLVAKPDDVGAVLLITASRDRNVTVFEAKSLRELRTVALGHPLLTCAFASPFVGVYGCENGTLGAFCVSPHTFGVVIFATKDAPTAAGTEEEHSVRGIAFLPGVATDASVAGEGDATTTTPAASAKKKPLKKLAGLRRKRGADDENAGAVSKTKSQPAQSTHCLLPETVIVVDASYRLFAIRAVVAAATSAAGGSLSAPVAASMICDQTDVLNFDQVMDVKMFPALPDRPRNDNVVIATNARDCYVTRGLGSSRLAGTLQGHTDLVVALDVSADGAHILTASKDMTARVWSAASMQCVGVTATNVHSAELTAVKFVPTMVEDPAQKLHLACTISFDAVLALWDVKSAVTSSSSGSAAVHELPSTATIASIHNGPAYCLALSPNGQYAATGGKDKAVNLWAIRGKKIFREGAFAGHRRTVACLAFSPVDKVVVSGANDGTVRLWSLVSLSCVRTLQIDTVPILQLAFFNGGTQIVTANSDGVTRYWATGAGECVATTTPHAERAWAMCVREETVVEYVDDEDDDADADEDEQQQQQNEDDDEQPQPRETRTTVRTLIVSGGADGTLACQQDFTEDQVRELRAERQETTAKEQRLRNKIREGDFADAFRLALTLNHPRHLRGVVVAWMAKTAQASIAIANANANADDNAVDSASAAVDPCEAEVAEIVASLSHSELHRLLEFTRQWLTNAKHSAAAGLVVAALLRGLHPTKLEALPAFVEVAEALHAYSKRHQSRLRRAQDQLYFLEYLTKGQLTTSSVV